MYVLPGMTELSGRTLDYRLHMGLDKRSVKHVEYTDDDCRYLALSLR